MYPMRSATGCKVCQSMDHRQEIEAGLLAGFSYTTILKSLPEGHGLHVRNISEHARNNHLPVPEMVRRVLIEDRAKERGLSIEDHAAGLADHVTLARMGVQRVIERMAAGELQPDIRDGISFAQILLRLEETAGEHIDNELMVAGFSVFMEAIRANCSPDQIQAIGRTISGSPVMAALMARTQAASLPKAPMSGSDS